MAGIYDAAPADRKNGLGLVLPADIHAPANKAQPRVGLHTAQLDKFNALILKGFYQSIVQAGSFYASAPVMQQHLFAVLFDLFAGLKLRAFSENDLCRVEELKVFHKTSPFI
jgi:hypothetical protein